MVEHQKSQIMEQDHVVQLWEDKEENKIIEDGKQVLHLIWIKSINENICKKW
jgi:hypothetical protein